MTSTWEWFSKIAVVPSSGFVISSGLLFWHFQRQESQMTFESISFLVCLFSFRCSISSGLLRRCSSFEYQPTDPPTL